MHACLFIALFSYKEQSDGLTTECKRVRHCLRQHMHAYCQSSESTVHVGGVDDSGAN